jgi:hypothetical protein
MKNSKIVIPLILLAMALILFTGKWKSSELSGNAGAQFFNNLNKIIPSNIEMAPIVKFGDAAYPVQIITTAARAKTASSDDLIGDIYGNFGAEVTVSGWRLSKTTVRLDITADRFVQPSSISAELIRNTTIKLFPQIAYNDNELRALTEPVPVNVTFRLYCNNELKSEMVKVVRFYSINEMPLNADPDIWAAFVNEDAPMVDQIITEALNIGIMDAVTGNRRANRFTGYQNDGNGEVYAQIFALWNVFQRRAVKYSNIPSTSNNASQYVRGLKDSFESGQANCVDGSVLFVSILQKIGIKSSLVLLPGHMMVGFWLDSTGQNYAVLEITMLNAENIQNSRMDDKTPIVEGLTWLFDGSKKEFARNSFINALNQGLDEYNAHIDEFKDLSNVQYEVIEIGECRKKGIMPINR